MSDYLDVTTPDGRTLEVLVGGASDGFSLLYHSGTPTAAVPYDRLDEVVTGLGLRLVTYSRPGYGGSTPRILADETGPRVRDDVDDSVTVLDHLGVDDFLTLGWSGGGPRALGCAAMLPGRCRAAATLAGAAPYGVDDLDFTAEMAEENVEEFAVAVLGATPYAALLERTMPPIFEASADDLIAAFGGLVTAVDAEFVTGDFADYMSRVFGRAGAQGVVGARDDGLAIVAPWGFDVAGIRVPVAVWQGRQDAMVPYGHGKWLAQHVPGAEAHLFDDEGHLSLFARMEEILADLKRLGGA
ncbi:MAG: alpha/beta hydrolase [Nocardioides sp.]